MGDRAGGVDDEAGRTEVEQHGLWDGQEEPILRKSVSHGGGTPGTRTPPPVARTGSAEGERSAAQQACARHHCRACGRVVCDGCSRRVQCLPQFGILEPARTCDACFFS